MWMRLTLPLLTTCRSRAFQLFAQEVPRSFGSARNETHHLLQVARGRAHTAPKSYHSLRSFGRLVAPHTPTGMHTLRHGRNLFRSS
jgi:hypothetical protein